MSELKDASIAFEAVKTSLTQTKTGIILRLAIHPNDVPTALIQDWVGTRYMVAMARLGDDDSPEASDYTERARRAVQSAGMLCRNESFHRYLIRQGEADEVADMETEAIRSLRWMLGVKSRAELTTNKQALEDFEQLRSDFEEWRTRNL